MPLATPLLLLCFSLSMSALAQVPDQFSAEIRADRLLPQQSVELIYTLENANGSNFTPPDFSPFEVLQGPSISNSLQIINGKRSSSVTYSFLLAAPSKGTYEIPAAQIEVNGKTLFSNTVTIEVVPQRNSSANERSKGVFVQYELSTDSPYIGEVLILDLVLYSKKRVHKVYKRNEPDRSGWYSLIFPVRPPPGKTVRQGQPYFRQVLSRELLYGQKAGPHIIDRLYLQVDLEPEEDQRSSPFSFFRSYDRREVYVSDTTVWVQSLPAGAPEFFSGLVGQPQVIGQLKDSQISRGKAAEYTVRLESYSDPNIVKPPRIITDGAEVLAPKLRQETKKDSRNGRQYIYIYDYLIVPDSSGVHEVYPEITYFDIETEEYRTTAGSIQELWVTEKPVQNQDKLGSENSDEKLKPLSDRDSPSIFSQWWLYILLLIGLLVLVFRFQKIRKEKPNPKASLEQHFDKLIQTNRPDPKELRKCLTALAAQEKKADEGGSMWLEYLKELDYLVFSPSSNSTDWDQILSKWRSQRQRK